MTYDYMVKQDGQFYKPGQDVPDMGTLVCTSAQGNVRSYEGLAKRCRQASYVCCDRQLFPSERYWRLL